MAKKRTVQSSSKPQANDPADVPGQETAPGTENAASQGENDHGGGANDGEANDGE